MRPRAAVVRLLRWRRRRCPWCLRAAQRLRTAAGGCSFRWRVMLLNDDPLDMICLDMILLFGVCLHRNRTADPASAVCRAWPTMRRAWGLSWASPSRRRAWWRCPAASGRPPCSERLVRRVPALMAQPQWLHHCCKRPLHTGRGFHRSRHAADCSSACGTHMSEPPWRASSSAPAHYIHRVLPITIDRCAAGGRRRGTKCGRRQLRGGCGGAAWPCMGGGQEPRAVWAALHALARQRGPHQG